MDDKFTTGWNINSSWHNYLWIFDSNIKHLGLIISLCMGCFHREKIASHDDETTMTMFLPNLSTKILYKDWKYTFNYSEKDFSYQN